MKKSTHQIKLEKQDGLYIILFIGTFEECEKMMNWYISHNAFFNGEFSIREI